MAITVFGVGGAKYLRKSNGRVIYIPDCQAIIIKVVHRIVAEINIIFIVTKNIHTIEDKEKQ